jgi:hypothetical protein
MTVKLRQIPVELRLFFYDFGGANDIPQAAVWNGELVTMQL